MRVGYLTCGSTDWGMGHLVRSSELARSLKEAGFDMVCAAVVPDEKDRERLKPVTAGFWSLVRSPEKFLLEGAGAVIVDVHDALKAQSAAWFLRLGLKTIALDWYDESTHLNAKINLRGDAGSLQCAIVRRELTEASATWSDRPFRYDALFLLGGNDHRGQLNLLRDMISSDLRYQHRRFALIAGPLMQDNLNASNSGRIEIFRAPTNLLDLMASSRIGISNGGGSLMEFTALGIPTVAFPQTQDESNFLRIFLNQGCTVEGSLEPNAFYGQLELLWRDQETWLKRSQLARALIDGQGTRRIVDVVKKVLLKT